MINKSFLSYNYNYIILSFKLTNCGVIRPMQRGICTIKFSKRKISLHHPKILNNICYTQTHILFIMRLFILINFNSYICI